MKAVLCRSLDPGRLVDLAYDLPAHAVAEAAFVLRAMARGFPRGTVHLVVVDPGVGGHRAPIVIACRDGSLLIGPDNGVLYPLAEDLGLRRAYRIRVAPVGGKVRVGTTFDGRDLFAPVAARLARGDLPSRLGPAHAPHVFRIPRAERNALGTRGEVVHTDHFGNLVTNVPTEWLPDSAARLRVKVGRGPTRILCRAESYEALGDRRLGVLGSSFGTLELAVDRGRADRRLRAAAGTSVQFHW
jgi:S-adenosylmethionine hydrolase